MALFKPYKITSSRLNSLPIKEGQFIFTTDDQALYVDVSNSLRIKVNADVISKVDGIEAGANNYTLPIASSTLGGVKTTSTETDMTHYEPAPISATGVVYTKNMPAVTEYGEDTAIFHYTSGGNINIERTTKVIASTTQPAATDLLTGDI